MAPEGWVVLGRVSGVFGIRGAVKVFSYTEIRPAILDYPYWWLGVGDARRRYKVMQGQEHGKALVAFLQGVDGRDAALALLNLDIAVPVGELPELPEDEYYWKDLVGLAVRNDEGYMFGTVDALFETGANDVLVVKGDGKETLIPYSHTLTVDLTKGELVVDWQPDYET